MFNGKIQYKWLFSIAMLNYQRVNGFNMFLPAKNYVFLIGSMEVRSNTTKKNMGVPGLFAKSQLRIDLDE